MRGRGMTSLACNLLVLYVHVPPIISAFPRNLKSRYAWPPNGQLGAKSVFTFLSTIDVFSAIYQLSAILFSDTICTFKCLRCVDYFAHGAVWCSVPHAVQYMVMLGRGTTSLACNIRVPLRPRSAPRVPFPYMQAITGCAYPSDDKLGL